MKNLNDLIIYQMALRTFTPEGTLKAAKELLPHVASLGVDVVYVCPFYVAEDDMRPEYWSKRQTASNTGNPQNPYKMADYFNVDPEYGTNEDLKAFAKEAHRLGLLVMYDLVYLHCGRDAVFVKEHPEYLVRNEDGSIYLPNDWPFARLNYACQGLRDYLKKNMEMLVTEYEADGFRCDVGDAVPLDFWQEAFAHVKAIKPELVMLNEGHSAEYVKETFDLSYSFPFSFTMVDVFAKGQPVTILKEQYYSEKQEFGGDFRKLLRTIDNHDIASDQGVERNEITMTGKGVEAALVITNTYQGISYLWNGYEFGDNAENCMFSNRFYGKRSAMDWSKAFTAAGKHRMEFIRKIHAFHHENDAIGNGAMEWVENTAPEDVISYVRISDKQKLLVVVNARNHAAEVEVPVEGTVGKEVLSSGVEMKEKKCRLDAYGYLVAEIIA